ncbi:DUF262 domain-containing protein [Bacillus sp. FJAT-29790]|uniref:DUF262 domain-containing protein n=1 Tax=Bacillus sp. FJAT-29790 TaxID=1895002 RepID=UPI001C241CA9|nr:DUF262 domain-containing protein [Bacillus sp. FJAT-29790]MBU8879225.1 DUF262 domain-containing protein [Bacillus sp. FJAT-29790]
MNDNTRYYSLTFSVMEIVNLIEDIEIEIDTSIYRNFIWSTSKQSLFIDSLYRNLPTPNLFLYEGNKNENNSPRYIVIDGIQRLKTIHAFIKGQLKINIKNSPLTGFSFYEMSKEMQRRFLTSRINITIVEDIWSDTKVIEEIFYRLNMGGSNLTSQEFRNRMYSGVMIDTINNLNENKGWRMFYNSPLDVRYRDSEQILKFFTIIGNSGKTSVSLSQEMDIFVQKNRHNEPLALDLQDVFKKTINIVFENFNYSLFIRNNRFDSTLYMTLFIPLGLLISKGITTYSFEEFSLILQHDFIRIKNLRTTKDKISFGMSVLLGDCND